MKKVKCPACGFIISSNYNHRSKIQELLAGRNKYTRKLLEKIELDSHAFNTGKLLEKTIRLIYDNIPSNNKTEKAFLFLQGINNVKDEIINWGIENYTANGYVFQGKGLQYLSAMINSHSKDRKKLKKNEELRLGGIPPIKELK